MRANIKFGTDGWRAIIGRDFNLKNVETVAQAFADYVASAGGRRRRVKVAVGYDTRRLSPQAARRISQVLAANRIKVVLSQGPLPAQAISFTVRSRRCSAGIMVTASHNPVQFNGIKIKGSFGGPLKSEQTKKIEQLLFAHRPAKLPLSLAEELGLLEIVNLVPAYLKFLRSYLNRRLLQKGRLKILVDSMHGCANSYIAQLLKGTPCQVTTLHKSYDAGFGGIKPEPIQSGLREAAGLMRLKSFDLGLANDGDADRIAALDGQGRFISPQMILCLLLLYFIRQRRLSGAVVKTIAGTALIDAIARKYRLKVYQTPVGFKYISELMHRKGILIGGEEAGGIGFKNYLPERDGILSGLLLVELLISQNKPIAVMLRQMQEEFGRYVYLRRDLNCAVNKKDKIKARLTRMRRRRRFLGKPIKRIQDFDGLKYYLADGSWILFRLSGTEAVLRIYAEARCLSETKRLIAAGVKIFSF